MVHPFNPAHADRLDAPERLVELPPERLAQLLELAGAEAVIDFGAGTGAFSLPLAAFVPRGELIAVDEQPLLLDYLRAKLAARPEVTNVRIVAVADGRVPLADGVAERLLMINVVHHVAGDPAALGEALRLLAPGGRALIVEFARSLDRPVGPPDDHLLALDDLRATLTRHGLRELRVALPGEIGRYHNVIVAEKPAS